MLREGKRNLKEEIKETINLFLTSNESEIKRLYERKYVDEYGVDKFKIYRVTNPETNNVLYLAINKNGYYMANLIIGDEPYDIYFGFSTRNRECCRARNEYGKDIYTDDWSLNWKLDSTVYKKFDLHKYGHYGHLFQFLEK